MFPEMNRSLRIVVPRINRRDWLVIVGQFAKLVITQIF
jgi:hypothetical protein